LLYHSVCAYSDCFLNSFSSQKFEKNRHYETNILFKLATFEHLCETLINCANFWVIQDLTASPGPKICTQDECFPYSFSRRRVWKMIISKRVIRKSPDDREMKQKDTLLDWYILTCDQFLLTLILITFQFPFC